MSQSFDADKTLQAWQRFVHMGELIPAIPAPVARSWFRCKNLGVMPVRLLPGQLPGSSVSQEGEQGELGGVFRQAFSSLTEYLKPGELLLALVDSQGVLLEWLGDSGLLVSGSLRKGLLFNEKTLGTMAVSLALREKDVFFVQGAQHYCSCYHRLASFAAPIMKGDACLGILGAWTSLETGSLAVVAGTLGKQVLEKGCIS